MRAKIVNRVLATFLEHLIGPTDAQSLFKSQTLQKNAAFLPDAFIQFGIPLSLTESSIAAISFNFEEPLFLLKFDNVAGRAVVNRPILNRKSFSLSNYILNRILDKSEVRVVCSNTKFSINEGLVLCCDQLTFSWTCEVTTVVINKLKLFADEALVFEKDSLEITIGSKVILQIPFLTLDIRQKGMLPLVSLFENINFEAEPEMVQIKDCAEAADIIAAAPAFSTSFDILIEKARLETPLGVVILENLRFADGLHIDRLTVTGPVVFTFADLSCSGRQLTIHSVISDAIRQKQPSVPFLTTTLHGNERILSVADFEFIGLFSQAIQLAVSLFDAVAVLHPYWTSPSSTTLEAPVITLLLNDRLRVSFSFTAAFHHELYQLSVERGVVEISDSGPLTAQLMFYISSDERGYTLLISPAEFRFTWEELQFLISLFNCDIHFPFPFIPSHHLQLNVITIDFVLCREVHSTKHNFFMVQLNDLSFLVHPESTRTVTNLTVNPSLKFWNAKTSFWDAVVFQFSLSVDAYSNSERHIDISINATSAIIGNISSSFLTALSSPPTPWGSESIRIQNDYRKSLRVSSSNAELGSIPVREIRELQISISTQLFVSDAPAVPFKPFQLSGPLCLSESLMVCPKVVDGGKVIYFSSPLQFVNSTQSRLFLIVFRRSGTEVNPLDRGERFSLFSDELNVPISITVPEVIDSGNFPKESFTISKLPKMFTSRGVSVLLASSRPPFQHIISITALYSLQNNLPIPLYCTFVHPKGELKCLVAANSRQSLLGLETGPRGFELYVGLDASKSRTSHLFERMSHSCVCVLSDNLQFTIALGKGGKSGALIFRLFSPYLVVNETGFPLNFTADGRILSPAFEIDSKIYYSYQTIPTLSFTRETPEVQLPTTAGFVDVQISQDKFFPMAVVVKKSQDDVILELFPRLIVRNSCDFPFTICSGSHSIFFEPFSTKPIDQTNRNFSFSLLVDGYSPFDSLVLSAPLSIQIRVCSDYSHLVFHLLIEESGESLLATLSPLNNDSRFVIVNELCEFPIFAQQSEQSLPIRIPPNSTTFFPFDSLSDESSIMLVISGKSQLVPLHRDIRGSFGFRVGRTRLVADFVNLRSDIQALWISSHSFSPEPLIFSLSATCKDFRCSILDTQLRQFLLVSMHDISFTRDSDSIKFLIKSIQIDDQTSPNSSSILMHAEPFVDLLLTFDSDLLNPRDFILLIHPFNIDLDSVLYHDLSFFFSRYTGISQLPRALFDSPNSIISFKSFHIRPILARFDCRPSGGRRFYFDASGGPDLQDRALNICVGSLFCEDLSVSPSALFFIISRHYSYLWSQFSAELTGIPDETPISLLLSRFQCASLTSELYDPGDIISSPSQNIHILQLPRITAFPVRTETVASIEYVRGRFLSITPRDHGAIQGKRAHEQVAYIAHIALVSSELRGVTEAVRRLAVKKEPPHTVLFVEYCGGIRSVICITLSMVFFWGIDEKTITRQLKVDAVKSISVLGKRLEFVVQERKLGKADHVHAEFTTEDLAEQAQLVLNSVVWFRKSWLAE